MADDDDFGYDYDQDDYNDGNENKNNMNDDIAVENEFYDAEGPIFFSFFLKKNNSLSSLYLFTFN